MVFGRGIYHFRPDYSGGGRGRLQDGKHGILQMKNGTVIVAVLFQNSGQFVHERRHDGRRHGQFFRHDKMPKDAPDTLNAVQIVNENVVQTIPEMGQGRGILK